MVVVGCCRRWRALLLLLFLLPLLVVNEGAFNTPNLKKAGYETNPLDGDDLARFRVIKLDISKLTLAAVAEFVETQRVLANSEDAAEGVRSFVERRPARFTGR